PVEAEDETTIDCDAVRLDLAKGFLGTASASGLEIRMLLDPSQRIRLWTFQPDQDLPAARCAHQAEEFFIIGDGDVGLGEPSHAQRNQLPAKLLAPGLVNKGIIIGKLDERALTQTTDRSDIADDILDGSFPVPLPEHHVGS